jgi:hypothetical protein
MGVVDKEITCGDFKALRRLVMLTGIPGEWTKGKNGHRQFRTANGAVLNYYWKSTGTVTFQGRDLPAAELKAMSEIGREPVGTDSVRYRRPDRPRLGQPLF